MTEERTLWTALCRKRRSSWREHECFRNGKRVGRVECQSVTRREAGEDDRSQTMSGLTFCARNWFFNTLAYNQACLSESHLRWKYGKWTEEVYGLRHRDWLENIC